jgi:cardiolipin synthase
LCHPPAGLGSDTGTQVQALLQGVMTQSKPITLQAWQHRTFDERLREWRARLWQYWM